MFQHLKENQCTVVGEPDEVKHSNYERVEVMLLRNQIQLHYPTKKRRFGGTRVAPTPTPDAGQPVHKKRRFLWT